MPAPLPIARFRPRLIDALRGYDRARFARDVAAGLTVGVVALPLAMAFAIAAHRAFGGRRAARCGASHRAGY